MKIIQLKLEILPRFGTKIGIIWAKYKYEEENDGVDMEKEDTIGHIRLENEKDVELWKNLIKKQNLIFQEESRKETK